jgi:plasmid stabilization system protein ParE
LSLSVGVDARLEQVKLEIRGCGGAGALEGEARARARLLLEKALDTIAENPEILRILARSLSRVVRERLGEALTTLDSLLEGLEVGDTVDEALRGGWRKFAPPSRRSCSANKEGARALEPWRKVVSAIRGLRLKKGHKE